MNRMITTCKYYIHKTYINIIKSIYSKLVFSDTINKINLNDYYIYKMSGMFKEVTIEELKEFKYAGYILFNKEYIEKDNIDKYIQYLKDNKIGLKFLNKPFPDVKLINKIKIHNG